MSIIEANIRLLAIKLKRFFNTLAVLPVRVLTAFRVVVPYENALHRVEIWESGDDAIDCATTGDKLIKKVPDGEIWIPEHFQSSLSTGTTAKLEQIKIKRKGEGDSLGWHVKVTAAVSFGIFRGTDFGVNMWAYPRDEFYLVVQTSNAGDKARVKMQVRILRVGDDF